MQFFIIIILNIFIGTVFYLVISLKLEKSASEFREKKLRKFMDDIIKEFNQTAERNISLLENKISILRTLLKSAGVLEKIDINVSDDFKLENVKNSEKNDDCVEKKSALESAAGYKASNLLHSDYKMKIKNENVQDTGRKMQNSFIEKLYSEVIDLKNLYKEKITAYLNRPQKEKTVFKDGTGKSEEPDSNDINFDSGIFKELKPHYSDTKILEEPVLGKNNTIHEKIGCHLDVKIDKNYDEIYIKDIIDSEKTEIKTMDDNEVASLFEDTADKYSLICDLHEKGYSIDSLSRFSGIPVGEIKLVLNLSSS